MEETIPCILHGCHLARELEANLQTLIEQPNSLSRYCEEITEIFHRATDLLRQQPQQSQSEICLRSAIRPVNAEMTMGRRDVADPETSTRFGGSAGEFQATDASNRSSNSQRWRRRWDSCMALSLSLMRTRHTHMNFHIRIVFLLRILKNIIAPIFRTDGWDYIPNLNRTYSHFKI